MVCTNQEHAAMMRSIIQGFVSPPEEVVMGYVSSVVTYKNEQRINVRNLAAGSEPVQFKFPPNAAPFQVELIRAHDTGFNVIVKYAPKAGNYVIVYVDLWEKIAVDA